MDADKIAKVVRYAAPPVLEKKPRDTFLRLAFSVKLEIAKDLVPWIARRARNWILL